MTVTSLCYKPNGLFLSLLNYVSPLYTFCSNRAKTLEMTAAGLYLEA